MKLRNRVGEWDAKISEPLIRLVQGACGIVALYLVFGYLLALPLWLTEHFTGWRLDAIIRVVFWLGPGSLYGFLVYRGRRFRPPKHNECARCYYDLTGNTSGICPECGTPIPKEPAEKSPRTA
jgi:hypothetical protein